MKISVVSGILGDYSLDESLKYLHGLGVDEFELGVGGYPGKAHADALVLSKDKKAREQLLETFERNKMGISALSVHGNCVHPDPEVRGPLRGGLRSRVRARRADRRKAHRHLLRLPRLRRRRAHALLGHLRVAHGSIRTF